jgi:two-component system, cell cycle sensor histidine kinase and response regulator CckA
MDAVVAERHLRGVVDSVGDAILSADADSRIMSWNAGAARMFGWSAQETIGRDLTMLMPERFRAGHRAGVARLVATGEPKLVGTGPVQLEGLRRDGTEFPIELTLGAWSGPEGQLFTGVVRDISERRELERYRRAQVAVASALAGAMGIEEAGTGVLEALGEAVGWPLGALWLQAEDGRSLRCAALWHAPASPAADFERQSRALSLERGSGLPGRVWESGEPVWLDDFASQAGLPRMASAHEAGLRAAVGLPLLSGGEAVGVLEFFSGEVRRPTPDIVALIATLSEQVGHYLQRRRAEEQVAEMGKELARRRDAQRHGQEINSHVIHHLVQASEALDAGDLRRAQAEMRRTLEEASRIVTDLGLPSS